MQDYIYVYDNSWTLRETITETVTAKLTERLSGELTLYFTTKYKRLPDIDGSCVLVFRGQCYAIVSLEKSSMGNGFLLDITAEQASISLADSAIENFEFAGTAAEAMSLLLSETLFNGESDISDIINVSSSSTNRRAVLLEIAELCGGEIEYDGFTVRILKKRGKTLDENIVTLAKCYDIREVTEITGYTGETNTQSYRLTGLSPDGYAVGDEVPLIFAPLGIDTVTRIIGISYNPFNCTDVTIEAGEYIKDTTSDAVDYEKLYLKKSEASIEFENYINSAEGKAGISAALEGTYITADALNDYVQITELDAKIGAYLDGAEGTASIVSAVSGKFMEKQPDAVFSTPSGATYGFSLSSDGYYTSTNTGISSSYSYGKITFNTAEATTITLSCISYGESNYDYGIISTLGADLTMSSSADSSNVLKSFKGLSSITPVEITLDIPAGESYITFKYIKDGSADSYGDYFKIKVKGVEYATVSEVGASIEQTINAFEASITLSASTSGNSSTLTLKSGSTTLASADITFSGFVTFNDLSTSGSTTINGANITTGTISAERIDTSTLRAQKVYYYDGASYYSIVSAELSGYNTYTHIGPKDIDNDYLQYLMLWGQPIIFASPQCDDQLSVDLLEREILPSNSGAWDIGSESYYFYNIYSRYYHLHRGGYIYETSSSLRYSDPNGTIHTLVSY